MRKQYAGQIPDKATDAAGYKEFQQYVLEYMITFELVTQEAEAKKLTVSDADVQAEIDKVITGTFAGDQTQFDAALTEQGITLEDLKKYYQENLLFQKVYDDVTKSVAAVTDAEAQSYYDENKTDYYTPEYAHCPAYPADPGGRPRGRHHDYHDEFHHLDHRGRPRPGTPRRTAESTTTTAAPTQADWDSALAAAKLVRQQLVAGADWTIEAKVYSDDPGSKDAGGDLGSFGQGDMVEEFDEAVFSMKVDEISEPIKTTYRLSRHPGDRHHAGRAVRRSKRSRTPSRPALEDTKKEAAWQDWLTAQKTKTRCHLRQRLGDHDDDQRAPTATSTGAGDTTTTVGSGDTTTTAARLDDHHGRRRRITTAGGTSRPLRSKQPAGASRGA